MGDRKRKKTTLYCRSLIRKVIHGIKDIVHTYVRKSKSGVNICACLIKHVETVCVFFSHVCEENHTTSLDASMTCSVSVCSAAACWAEL